MLDHPYRAHEVRIAHAVAAPVVYAGLGVEGLLLLLVRGPGDVPGLLALLFSLAYLVWWAALERASATPRLSLGRRLSACVLATSMVAICHATMVLSIGEVITGGRVSPSFAGLGVMVILGTVAWWGPQFWQTLRVVLPFAGARRLLQVITGSAAGALVLHLVIFVLRRDFKVPLTGPLAAAIAGAALVLGWTVVPWLRYRRAAAHAVQR